MGRKLSTDLFFLISIILVVAIGVLSQQSTSVTKSILKNNFRQVTITEGEYVGSKIDGAVHAITSTVLPLAPDIFFGKAKEINQIFINLASQFSNVANVIGLREVRSGGKVEIVGQLAENKSLWKFDEAPKIRDGANFSWELSKQGKKSYYLLNVAVAFEGEKKRYWLIIAFDEIFFDRLVADVDTRGIGLLLGENVVFSPNKKTSILINEMVKRPDIRALNSSIIGSGFVENLEDSAGSTWFWFYHQIPRYGMTLVKARPLDILFAVTDEMVMDSAYLAMALILVGLLVSYLASSGIINRLRAVIMTALKIAEGQYGSKAAVKGHFEVQHLAKAVNYLGDQVALQIETEKERIRFEAELNTARGVQLSFFKDNEATENTAVVSGFCEFASECGGDWWGRFSLGEGRQRVYLADASGHGSQASLVTALIFGVANQLHNEWLRTGFLPPIEDSVRIINEVMSVTEGHSLTGSMVAFEVDEVKKTLNYCSAGHCPGYVFPKDPEHDERIRKARRVRPFFTLSKSVNNILGISKDFAYKSAEISIKPHDRIVFYTDGYIELPNPKGLMYGVKRFTKAVASNSDLTGSELHEFLIKDIEGFSQRNLDDDDMTLVIVDVG